MHQLLNDTSIAHAFDLGKFFNKQSSGLRVKDIVTDENLKKSIQPLATFEGSGFTYDKRDLDQPNEERLYDPTDEFVAIAEGIDLPVYLFTYNVEMTQFVSTEIMDRDDQEELLDKSIPARHHAQFIAHQIADEGRLSSHRFDEGTSISDHLITNHKLASVEYPVEEGDEHLEYPLPRGLEKHDIYIIKNRSKLS